MLEYNAMFTDSNRSNTDLGNKRDQTCVPNVPCVPKPNESIRPLNQHL